jgi:TatD DNase family protein
MWIDTHCHLDADEFDSDRDAVVARARAAGVSMIVLPPGHVDHFAKAARVAHDYRFAYALGLHPLWIDRAEEAHIDVLRAAVMQARDERRFVAIGEIGLDFFVPGLDRARQEWFYREQLRVARDFDLPVIVHVRRSADVLLKHLRRIEVCGGIVHAFNGSEQQARQFIERGFRLGFGGAMTYAGSVRIRRLAAEIPEEAIVLETDAPDIPPAWLRDADSVQRNEPAELPRIAATMMHLRGVGATELAQRNRTNAMAALPRLAPLLEPDAEAGDQ